MQSSAWNFSNKLLLLEAEYYLLRGDGHRAVAAYEASIKAAREHRFVHEEGLAAEKLASFHASNGETDRAMSHLSGARACYEKWGAHMLVQRVDQAIAILVPLCAGT